MMKINKKIKAFMSIIIACFMCVGVLLSIKTDVYADSSKEYVYDNAGILTADEISKLKSQCKKASEDSECDIVIITTNIGHDGSTMDSYLKKFLDDTVSKAHETGGVSTMFGRRRDLPAIKSRNFMQRSLAERMAMNTPIQGTAADIIKLAMIAAWRELKAAGVKSRILLQVHDELVLEVCNEELEQVSTILREAMEHVVTLSVPLIIDIHSGKNWAEAK